MKTILYYIIFKGKEVRKVRVNSNVSWYFEKKCKETNSEILLKIED